MQSLDSRKPVRKVLVVGGGTAGWLAACHIARAAGISGPEGIDVTLIESKDIPTVGVGEGTVPAMRQSLHYLGIRETDFISECEATFKQSIKFVDWMKPADSGNAYHHVFDYPEIQQVDLTPYWLMGEAGDRCYVDAVSIQGKVCDSGLGPKLMTHAEFEGATNYAYHLDAAKFAALLTRHATGNLGVRHLLGNVQDVNVAEDGSIRSIMTDEHGELAADLFVDCTGFRSLLLGETLGTEFIDKNDVLFVDNALAIQVPYADEQTPIPCHTIATARSCGWIWDIGLHTRRGTGYVYSEKYTSHEAAESVFRDYLRESIGDTAEELDCRRIPMKVGYREEFWVGNCVAIGLAQGFVEPLEATGLLVFDATARMLGELLPPSVGAMPAIAERFNRRVRYAWDRVIDFIKLHYYLSDRDDSDFWRDNRDDNSVPDSLLENLHLWREQPPSDYDFFSRQEIFKLENYLYVLYGMRFQTDVGSIRHRYRESQQAQREFERIDASAAQAMRQLLPHRELIERIKTYGLQKV
jgi:tryptophan halogenase